MVGSAIADSEFYRTKALWATSFVSGAFFVDINSHVNAAAIELYADKFSPFFFSDRPVSSGIGCGSLVTSSIILLFRLHYTANGGAVCKKTREFQHFFRSPMLLFMHRAKTQ